MAGDTLDSVVYTLLAAKSRGEHVYCVFKGHTLYSDTVSMDLAYMEVMGCTKAERDQQMEEWIAAFEKSEQTAKEKAIENIPVWIERGKSFIFLERFEEWEKCVKVRATGTYNGTDLEAALEIMEALENGRSMEEAQKMFYDQNLSVASAAIVRNVIFTFSTRGPEFWESTAYGEISLENRQILEAKNKKIYNLQK